MYKIPCKPDPNDAGQMICTAMTGSWAHNAAQIAIELEEIDTSAMDTTPGLELVEVNADKEDKVFPQSPDIAYTIIKFNFGKGILQNLTLFFYLFAFEQLSNQMVTAMQFRHN